LETDCKSYTLWKRFSGKENNFVYAAAFRYLIGGGLGQYDASLGYESNDYDVYLKHKTGKDAKSI